MAYPTRRSRPKKPTRSLSGRLVLVAFLLPLAIWMNRPEPIEPPSVARRIRLSLVALQSGRLDRARALAFEVLDDPDLEPWALAQLAEILFGCHNIDAAAEAALRGLELDPANPDLRLQLGLIRAAQGLHLPSEARMDEAFSILTRLVQDEPESFLPRVHLGNLYRLRRQADLAILHLEEASRIAPRSGHAHNMLGICYEWRQRWEDADRAYRASIAADPTIFKAYTNLGALFHKRGDPDKARLWYRKSLEVNPNYGRTKVLLARLDTETN